MSTATYPPTPPLLGVAGHWGAAEIALARRLDELHQLIYTRGGIRPSNAAVEELAKLVLVRLWSLRRGDALFTGGSVADFQAAFAAALAAPDLVAVDPAGRAHPVWPPGEPFRLADQEVLNVAAGIVAGVVDHGQPSVSDPLGVAFDALLAGRYDHAGGLGTYLTPSGVARMMAEIAISLVDASPDGSGPGFGDPYCGTGRFLVATLEVLRALGASELLTAGGFGADQSPSAVAKARINMLLYGVGRPLVWSVADSVTDSDVDRLRGRVPLILTNPPFGEGKYDDPDGVAATTAAIGALAGRRRLDPSLVGLVRSLRLLAPGGVLGIVLPDGVVASRAFAHLVLGSSASAPASSGGASPRGASPRGASPCGASLQEASLVGGVTLAAVVSLPAATFALGGTAVRTSAVFLRRAARRPAAPVALARVSHLGYLRQGGRAAPDPQGNQLPEVSRLVRAGLGAAGDDGAAAGTAASGAGAPLVVLTPADAVRTLDPSTLDPDALAARAWLTERGGVELRELIVAVPTPRARVATSPFISVLHVDDLGTVDWQAARTHAPATPGLHVADGDLLVSLLNPSKPRATVIPTGTGPVQVSAEFGVFRATGDPYAVLALLYSPRVVAQLRPLGTGTSSSRRRIEAADVLGLVVPKLTAAEMDLLGRAVADASARIAQARAELRACSASLPSI